MQKFSVILLSAGWLASQCLAETITIPVPKAKKKIRNQIKLSPMKHDMTMQLLSHYTTDELKPQDGKLKIAESQFPMEVFKQLSTLDGKDDGNLTFKLLRTLAREGVHNELRHIRHSSFTLPSTLKKFRSLMQYQKGPYGPKETWTRRVIKPSKVKGTTRIIYRSQNKKTPHFPKGMPSLHIAETVGKDEKVRETEIIYPRDKGKHYGFFVYDQKGILSKTSTFQSSTKKQRVVPAPYTCLTCHYDKAKRVFTPR